VGIRTWVVFAVGIVIATAAVWNDGDRTPFVPPFEPPWDWRASGPWGQPLRRLDEARARLQWRLRPIVPGRQPEERLRRGERWPGYWSTRAAALPAHDAALARARALLEPLRSERPEDGVGDLIAAALELEGAGDASPGEPAFDLRVREDRPAPLELTDRAAFSRATLLVERAASSPRLELGDAEAVQAAAAPTGPSIDGAGETASSSVRRLTALAEARATARRAAAVLAPTADVAIGLAARHAGDPAGRAEAERLLLALRRVGLRLAATSRTSTALGAGIQLAIRADQGEAIVGSCFAVRAGAREEEGALRQLRADPTLAWPVLHDELGHLDLELILGGAGGCPVDLDPTVGRRVERASNAHLVLWG
jgi:hypothetical protein